MYLIPTTLVYILFSTLIPTSTFNFMQLFFYTCIKFDEINLGPNMGTYLSIALERSVCASIPPVFNISTFVNPESYIICNHFGSHLVKSSPLRK